MARWRTHNKRAKRRHQRDDQLRRDAELLLERLSSLQRQSDLKRVCDEFGRALSQAVAAMSAAFYEAAKNMTAGWRPLDPRHARVIRRRSGENWPDVVLEDILDAEYIEEPE